MTQSHRLREGGIVDRARPLRFDYDGARYEGYAGDTLASALLANGVHLVARSFKYHRPRGIHSAGVEEPNALRADRRAARAPSPTSARRVAASLRRIDRGEPEPLAVASLRRRRAHQQAAGRCRHQH